MQPASLNGETKDSQFKLKVDKLFRVPTLTTSERNKLKVEKGLLVFNTSLGKLQIHDGTDWVSVH